MKQKQQIAFLGMVIVTLILAACGGDSGNNGTEMEGNCSSSTAKFSGSSVGELSSLILVSSSSAKGPSNSSISLSSSSSSVGACTNIYGTNTVTDCRDNQTYRTVTIGTQTWMAENLNYAVDSSWCYENSADSCAKYGRLYPWVTIMSVASTYNFTILGDSVNHQGICPDGWHVPRSSEWTTLENYVGGSGPAGTYLKATNGWISYSGISNLDSYGFSALPGGYYYKLGFSLVGTNGDWWTATEYSSLYAYYRHMYFMYTDVGTYSNHKVYGRSLRCLKD